MTDDEVLNEFTRVIAGKAGPMLECLTISWPHPSTPESHWVPVKTLPAGAAPETVESERRDLLQRGRFFRTCAMCGERQPLGWMCDDKVCQSCASAKLGVVF